MPPTAAGRSRCWAYGPLCKVGKHDCRSFLTLLSILCWKLVVFLPWCPMRLCLPQGGLLSLLSQSLYVTVTASSYCQTCGRCTSVPATTCVEVELPRLLVRDKATLAPATCMRKVCTVLLERTALSALLRISCVSWCCAVHEALSEHHEPIRILQVQMAHLQHTTARTGGIS